MDEFEPTFSVADFRHALSEIGDVVADYLIESRNSTQPVLNYETLAEITERLELSRFIEESGPLGNPALLGRFVKQYLPTTIRLNDPRFIGHQVARPHFASALADMVNGMTNNGMAVYEMGPGPVALERFTIEWLLKFVPWPSGAMGADGFLTHGGSLANLTAMLAARGTFSPKAWEQGIDSSHVFLLPDSSHYCLQRAVCIIGYGKNNIRFLPTNSYGQIEVAAIEPVISKVIADGLKPVMICANACTTSSGLYDDLAKIGEITQRYQLWFHVDGAHGASALISDVHRAKLQGLELADSLVWDQHKLLQTSALCTAVLFRDASSLNRIFQQQAAYLNSGFDDEHPDLFHQTIECTKVPLGLKFFLCLLATGERGMAEMIDVLFTRTQQLYELINSHPRFQCLCPPESNILCFEFRSQSGEGVDEALPVFEIRDQVIASGDYYFTRTKINDRQYFRFTVTNPETSDHVVSGLLDKILSCC